MDIKNIRQVSKDFTSEEITKCIEHQLEDGSNVCLRVSDDLIGDLSKAEYIRKQMENGIKQPLAIRELAARIRKFS